MSVERRKQPRYKAPEQLASRVVFQYRPLGNDTFEMPIKDLSPSGVSFTLTSDLPKLEVGDCIARVKIHLGEDTLRGDLLIMHLSPGAEEGAVCGGLYFPSSDEDILKLQGVIRMLEQEKAELVAEAT